MSLHKLVMVVSSENENGKYSMSGALMVGHVLFDFERHRILKDFQQLCKFKLKM
jgi:hypothetical protein